MNWRYLGPLVNTAPWKIYCEDDMLLGVVNCIHTFASSRPVTVFLALPEACGNSRARDWTPATAVRTPAPSPTEPAGNSHSQLFKALRNDKRRHLCARKVGYAFLVRKGRRKANACCWGKESNVLLWSEADCFGRGQRNEAEWKQ